MRVPLTGLAILGLAIPAAHADKGDQWDGITVLEQAGGGVAGGVVLGGIGLVAGIGLGGMAGKKDNWSGPLVGGALGMVAGAVAGTTIGVKLAGDHRDGNGSWGATTAGAVIGGCLTLLTAPHYAERIPRAATLALGTLTMVGPAIVAYQLSHDDGAVGEKRVIVPLMFSF